MPNRSRSSSRDRLLRLRLLRRPPLSRPVAVVSPSSSPSPRRKKARFVKILAPLVLVALLVLAGAFYVRQTVDVERIVRTQLIPQLEKRLNARVEIGRIESDYRSRVTLHDVVIGRDAKLPLGALAQIESATLNLDLPRLVFNRDDVLAALKSVDLQSPRVVVQRDAQGVLNWAKLWKSAPQSVSSRWNGTLTAQNGRVWFQDATILSRRGVPLVADMQSVALKVVANGDEAATFSAQIPQTFVGHKPQQTLLRNVSLDGKAEPAGKWFSLRAKCAQIPVALPIEYSIRNWPLTASGEIGGALQIAFDSGAPQSRRFALAAQAVARRVSLQLNESPNLPVALRKWQTRLSQKGETFSVQEISGAFSFGNRAFSTSAMTLQTLGASWEIDGEAAFPTASQPVFSLSLQMRDADASRLAHLVSDGKTVLRGGLSSANLRVAGDAENARIGGDVTVPNVVVSNAQIGRMSGDSLRLNFSTDSKQSLFNGRFSLRNAGFQNARNDRSQFRALYGTVVWAPRNGATQLNLEARAPAYSARQSELGTVGGENLNMKLVAVLRDVGGVWNGRGNLDFASANLSMQRRADSLRATSARAKIGFKGTLAHSAANLNFNLGGVAWRAASFGDGQAKRANGQLVWRNALPQTPLSQTPLSADVSFDNLDMRPSAALGKGRAANSQLRARDFRVLVSTSNARDARARWSGVASFANVDAAALKLANWAPQTARRVRDLGVLNGRAQFEFDRANPARSRLSSDLGLSRAQIDSTILRAISARVVYADGVVRVANGRAQSEQGALLLDALYDTRRATGNLALNAPFVTVESARINPFLRALGLIWNGAASGQVRVATSLNGGVLGPLQTRFDVRAPRSQLRNLQNRVLDGAVLNAGETRLSGDGMFQNRGASGWKFVGRAEMRLQNAQIGGAAKPDSSSLRLGKWNFPVWLRGAQVSGLRLISQGEVSSVSVLGKSALKPQISGTLGFSRAVLALPSRRDGVLSLVAPSFVLQNAQAAFNLNDANWQVARWQLQTPQLQTSQLRNAALKNATQSRTTPILSGFFNLKNGALSGQILARDIDASRAQALADRVLPAHLRQSQPAVRGVLFARATLDGTLASPRALLQTRLYRGAVSSQGAEIPIDAARLEIALALAMSRLDLRNLTLWSRGGRLAARGTLSPTIEYSIAPKATAPNAPATMTTTKQNSVGLDLSLQLSNWRVRELEKLWSQSSLQNLTKGAPSSLDGVLSGDLRLTGTTGAPRLAGRAALKLATFLGADIAELTAQIDAQGTPRGPRLLLRQIDGRVEDAPIAGEATFDLPAKTWSARVSTTDLSSQRLVRLIEKWTPENWKIAPPPKARRTPWQTRNAVSARLSALSNAPVLNQENPETASVLASQLPTFVRRESQNARDSVAKVVDGKDVVFKNVAKRKVLEAPETVAGRGRIALQGKLRAVLEMSGTFGSQPTKTNAEALNATTETNARNRAARTPQNGELKNGTTKNANTKTEGASPSEAGKSAATSSASRKNADAEQNGDNENRTKNRAVRNGAMPNVVARSGATRNGVARNETVSWIPVLQRANATVVSDDLSWRGRDLGALTSSFSLRDGVVRIADFSLLRRLSAKEILLNAVAQRNAGTDATPGENAVAVPDNVSDELAQIRLGGSFPLAFNDARAVPFDATLTVENERFSVLREALKELSRVLTARGLQPSNLAILLRRVEALPSDLEGRLNAKTRVGGRWGALSVGLDANIDNARTSTQSLPALQTSLVFADGAIGINAFEIKQTFEENADGELAPSSGFADDGAGDTRRVRETALRVAPGGRIVPDGEISLDVDVLKANLAQLSGWLPELRPTDGKAFLRGELSLFSFEVRGQTASPEVTGSVEARDLSYRTYTLDRLRVAQFSIKDGMLSVEPGKLTVVKGGFQSSAVYGSVPWSWGENGSSPGPRRDGALGIHLPLQTRDFGALAGALVPALTNVAAEGFSGSVDVTGSLDKPQLNGEIKLTNARFRADPVSGPFAFGVKKLSGALRFLGGNRVLVDALSGQLLRAQAVGGTATGNRSAAERKADSAERKADSPIATSIPPQNALRKAIQSAQMQNAQTPNEQTQNAQTPRAVSERPDVSGRFALNGAIDLDFGIESLSSADMSRAASRLPFHRYDLNLTLRDGAFRSANFSGLRDIFLDATWKTGEGAPQNAQNLSWKIGAKGRPSLNEKRSQQTRGALSSQANVRLAPNFADSLNALLHSRFDGNVNLKNLGWEVRDLGRGVLDGDLKLDNSLARENAETVAPKRRIAPNSTTQTTTINPTQTLAKATSVAPKTAVSGAVSNAVSPDSIWRSSASMSDIINGVAGGASAQSSTRLRDDAAQNAAARGDFSETEISSAQTNANANINANANGRGAPLRVAGALVLSQTEVKGLPLAGAGGVDILAPAPNFDIALSTGKDVRFTTPTLRVEFNGALAISGTPRAPRIVGALSTRNGQIRFPNASARIDEGTIEIEIVRDAMTQQLRPRATIDATARGQVGRYAISIALRGPLDLGSQDAQNLRVDVTSNPPLSQDEAFAQLTGTSLRDLNSGSPVSGNAANQAYARAVVSLLSAPLFSGLERSLEQSLGLNSLTLDYRLNEPLGVEIGKAIGDRVFVTYRRSLARGTVDRPASSVRVDVRVVGGVQLGIEGDDTGRRRVTVGKTFRF